MIADDHPLHSSTLHIANDNQPVICESCIEKHELWVLVVDYWPEVQGGEYRTELKTGSVRFYDHLTGELLGYGVIRKMDYSVSRHRKLSVEQVREIRNHYHKSGKIRDKEFAAKFGVTRSAIQLVRNRYTWAWLRDEA